jgi:hypothetical protein
MYFVLAYHPRLKVYALPRKSSVALFQCVEHLFDPMSCHVDNLDPSSELLLHNVDGKEISKQKKALFRLIEWSNGDNQNLLAIASTDRLEIWSVQNNE